MYTMSFPYCRKDIGTNKEAKVIVYYLALIYFYNIVPVVLPVSV